MLLLGLLAAVYVTWDSTSPEVKMENSSELGAESTIFLVVDDQDRGIESVKVVLRQGEYIRSLYEEINPKVYFPWEKSKSQVLVELNPGDWLDRNSLKEGPFELAVAARDAGDYGLFSDTVEMTLDMTLDMTPPGIEVLSTQHNIRRGGAEAVRYRLKGDGYISGVMVGENSFQGYQDSQNGTTECTAVFVWSHEQPADVPVRLWAEDRVGKQN